MAINSHILPGDLVAPVQDVGLRRYHPDLDPNGDKSRADLRMVERGTPCLVLAVYAEHSSKFSRRFFVLTCDGMMNAGWVRGILVDPLVTQRLPEGA